MLHLRYSKFLKEAKINYVILFLTDGRVCHIMPMQSGNWVTNKKFGKTPKRLLYETLGGTYILGGQSLSEDIK